MIPRKLKSGSHIRIIGPSCTLPSITWLDDSFLDRAKNYFKNLGMTVSEGKYLREIDEDGSTSIEHRVEDMHAAFADPDVDMVSTIRGGWNCNQLLPYLDYELIKKNPKILCGFSDITALSNAIYAKTGVVTYSGPNFHHFGFGKQVQYSHDFFAHCCMESAPFDVVPSKTWTDDYFTADHQTLKFEANEGWWMIHEGSAQGTSIGGNLCTLSLLQGTEYMPQVRDGILFVEDDHETHPRTFDRDLTSLTQQPWFSSVRGVLVGRCQKVAVNQDFGAVTKEKLHQIVTRNEKLRKLPVIANVDFGHTHPMITFPIGGTVRIVAGKKLSTIKIVNH